MFNFSIQQCFAPPDPPKPHVLLWNMTRGKLFFDFTAKPCDRIAYQSSVCEGGHERLKKTHWPLKYPAASSSFTAVTLLQTALNWIDYIFKMYMCIVKILYILKTLVLLFDLPVTKRNLFWGLTNFSKMSSGLVSVTIHTAVFPPVLCLEPARAPERLEKRCNKGPAACKASTLQSDESGLSEKTGLIFVIFFYVCACANSDSRKLRMETRKQFQYVTSWKFHSTSGKYSLRFTFSTVCYITAF